MSFIFMIKVRLIASCFLKIFIEDIMHNQNCNIEHYTGFVFTKLSSLINKID
jgi:hypothetical protein